MLSERLFFLFTPHPLRVNIRSSASLLAKGVGFIKPPNYSWGVFGELAWLASSLIGSI